MRIFRSRTKTHKPLTHKAFVLWVPLCLLAALSLFIPSASTISEENIDVNVNLVNGVAIRILNSAATAEITELDLSTTAAPTGTFVTDNFKVEVSTANKTGYKLYMNSSYQNPSTSTYTTDLVNQTNTSYTIPTVAAVVSKTDLSTAAPGTTNANKWAYSLDDTTYSPVPANSVQTQIGSHDTPTAGTKTPVYIGMNINVEKPSGVYKNQLTFSAVGNPVPTDYTLYFEPGGTGVSDLPETMTYSGVAASHTFTIPSAAPTRAGYNFTGYSDGTTTYQPGGTITVQGDIDYTGSATLTAQWELVPLDQKCANASIGGTFIHDNVEYIKLKTNAAGTTSACYTHSSVGTSTWGDSGATYPSISICPAGTGVPTKDEFQSLINAYGSDGTIYNTTGWSGNYWSSTPYDSSRAYFLNVGSSYAGFYSGARTFSNPVVCIVRTPENTTQMQQMTASVCDAMNINDSLTLTDTRDSNTYTVAKLADERCWMTQNLKLTGPTSGSRQLYPADTDITATYWDLPAVNTDFGTSCSDTAKNMLAGGSDSYGAYYNWYAATAGTGTCSMSSGNATASICPKGWRLPTGGSSGEFEALYNKYSSSSAMLGSPVNFVLSGYRYYTFTLSQGSGGYYWSSTARSSANANYLYLDSSDVYPATSDARIYGYTVRCVAR